MRPVSLAAAAALAALGAALFIGGAGEDAEALRLTVSPVDPMPRNLVIALQAELAGRGFDIGAVDGHLGPATRRAIRDFRAWAGLPGGDGVDTDLFQALGRRP